MPDGTQSLAKPRLPRVVNTLNAVTLMNLKKIFRSIYRSIAWHYWSYRMGELGPGSRFESQITWHKTKKIAIGSNVFIKKRCRLEALNTGKTAGVMHLRIGDNTSLQEGCQVLAAQQVTIGKDVLIGANVLITDNNHIYDNPTKPASKIRELHIAPVTIKDGCWLGFACVILKGVTIGERTVIGANAVVTHDIPPYSVAVGIPARVINCFNPINNEHS
jgi:acetyltransferase-like isoleucine patch superfamily enzyme